MQSNETETQEASENIPVLPFYLFVLGNNSEPADALTWIDLFREYRWERILHLSKMNNLRSGTLGKEEYGILRNEAALWNMAQNGIILYFLIEVPTAWYKAIILKYTPYTE